MDHTAAVFAAKSADYLASDYLPKIQQCLARLSESDVWWRPNETSNSVGNLVLHLCGNVTQWIIGGVGRRPYERHRQQEFDTRTPVPTAFLVERVRAVVSDAAGIIRAQTEASLLERREIQRYDVTVLEAIYHVVEHFSMHTGQIIWVTKLRAGEDLRLLVPRPPSSS